MRVWHGNNPEKDKEYVRKPSHRYSSLKSTARAKGIEVTLTFKEFEKLISLDCHYCKGFFKKTTTGGGLDRINNNRGYHADNVLPCCGTCNRIRGREISVDEARAMIELLIRIRNGS